MEEFFTTEEAAKYLKRDVKTIKRYMQNGILVEGIHYFKPVKGLYFKASKLAEWVEGGNSTKIVDDICATI